VIDVKPALDVMLPAVLTVPPPVAVPVSVTDHVPSQSFETNSPESATEFTSGSPH